MSAVLIAKGTLPARTVEHLELVYRGGYSYFVEVSGFPPGLYDWAEQRLPHYSSQHEGCMGNIYTRRGPHYCTFGDDRKFIGFRTAAERDCFAAHFPGWIVDAEPFSSGISLWGRALRIFQRKIRNKT